MKMKILAAVYVFVILCSLKVAFSYSTSSPEMAEYNNTAKAYHDISTTVHTHHMQSYLVVGSITYGCT